MEPVKIIARFRDGRMTKGHSQDFFPNKATFRIYENSTGISGEPIEVKVNDLKAIFFVKTFEGDPQHQERKTYLDEEKASGRKVEVTFSDGEVMEGAVLGYNPRQAGFFLFPIDSEGNNIRIFVVNESVKHVRYL
jgi:hypothetical protein